MRKVRADFDAWFARLNPAAQKAIEKADSDLDRDPRIAQGHPNADYARRTFLLEAARTANGFKDAPRVNPKGRDK